MKWRGAQFVAAMLVAVAVPPSAAAHFGSSAYIIVPADHVLPGEQFEVVGADLTPGSPGPISFHMVREGVTTPLDDAASGPDGHFTARLSIPSDYPGGYAQLFATATDGMQTSTWILVGTRTAETGLPPGTAPWWTDPSVIVLAVLVVGAFALVGYVLVRRSRTARQPVLVTPARPAANAPRKTRGKKSRR